MTIKRRGTPEEIEASRRRNIDNAKRWRLENPEQAKATIRAWNARNREQLANSRRAWKLKRNYGIAIEDFIAMLERQNHCCAICLRPERNGHRSGGRPVLSVDHDRETGRVRGLLCGNCNRALGLLDHSIEASQRIARYLKP